MSDETGVGAAAAMTSTHQRETDPVEGEKPSTTTQNQSSEVVGNDDGDKGMGAAGAETSAEPGGSSMGAANPGGMGDDSEAEQEALTASIKGAVTGATAVANSEPKPAAGAANPRSWGQGLSKEEVNEENESDEGSEQSVKGTAIPTAAANDSEGNESEEEVMEEGDVVVLTPAPDEKELLKQKLFEKGKKKNVNSLRKQAKWNEGSLFQLNIYGEDFQDRIDRLGASRTFAIRRVFVVLHDLKDSEDGSDIPCYVPCGETRTEIIRWYKNMFEKAGVLVRDVHAFLPENVKDEEARFEYELRTSYFIHQGKGWYFTPSLLYKPAYIDLNAPVFNSWLSNGDVVLYTPQGTVHEDGSFDEAANALTFVGAFFHWDNSEMRTQPDVRAVFVRSLSLLKIATDMVQEKKTGVFKTFDKRVAFVELDIDIMSWSAKKETELSWQIAL
jgi:hypothetical protein